MAHKGKQLAMTKHTKRETVLSIGIDVGDRTSHYTVLDAEKKLVTTKSVLTTPDAFRRRFARYEPCLVALEAGTHSPWAHEVLQEVGHKVFVVNPRRLALLTQSMRKSDKEDSEILARAVVSDLELVTPIQPRGMRGQEQRALLKLRDAAVRTRTQLITSLRGVIKPFGARLPDCNSRTFHKKAMDAVPEQLKPAVQPLITVLGLISVTIDEYDALVEAALAPQEQDAQRLQQVAGVGPITTLAFLATMEDPKRFPKSRMVGAYLGLTPRQHESGDQQPQLRITKAGDGMMRKYLVQAAHHVLGPFGPDSDLKRFGEALAKRGGKNAKKRSVIAVARKLSVLLMTLWRTGATYEPLRHASRVKAEAVPS